MLGFFLLILFCSINGITWLFIVNGSWDPANYKGKSAVFVTKMKTADTLILNYHMVVLKKTIDRFIAHNSYKNN